MALRLLVLLLLAGWVAGDVGASTSSASKQCPETGEYSAVSQEEVDAFAENYPECKQLISLNIASSYVFLAATTLIPWFLLLHSNRFVASAIKISAGQISFLWASS